MDIAIQTHNQRPAAVWSSGGPDYDQISRGISDSIDHCVLRLDPKPGESILDLATGTGWTSRVVARRGAGVTGVDIASELVAAAKARAETEGLAIDYRIGDAESLPFADGAFDGVISTCGVMFASRPEAAAAELARVTRRGGRIALTTWLNDSNVAKMFQVMKPYMAAPPTRRRLRLSSGAARSAFATCWRATSTSSSRRAFPIIASPPGNPPGRPFLQATVRPRPWPRALTKAGARSCGATSLPSTTVSRRNWASACRANTG
ncbi:class I SAM-dependent methyltransferase [Polaromonas sp. P1(28)-8]|nr:class I SAM-dependent methyltransferase [Polaromonas sp. P1(28)-8]